MGRCVIQYTSGYDKALGTRLGHTRVYIISATGQKFMYSLVTRQKRESKYTILYIYSQYDYNKPTFWE